MHIIAPVFPIVKVGIVFLKIFYTNMQPADNPSAGCIVICIYFVLIPFFTGADSLGSCHTI